MKKNIEAILNDLSDSNDYNLKYIPEHNYNELVDKLNALFSLNSVGSSLDFDKLRKQFNDIIDTFDEQKVQDWLDKKS